MRIIRNRFFSLARNTGPGLPFCACRCRRAVSCASWEHSLGIVQVAAVHVSMYLPNSLIKSLSRNSPLSVAAWQLVLPAAAPALSLLLVPPGELCRPGELGLVEGNRSHAIPTASPASGLKARGFKKLKIQPLYSSSVCRRAKGKHPCCSCWVLCWSRGLSRGTGMGSSYSDPGPCPGTTSVRGWRVWPHQDFPAT